METKKKKSSIVLKVIKIILIIAFWPIVLIFLVHKNEKIEKSAKKVLYIILAIVSLLWMVICLALSKGDKPSEPTNTPQVENTPAVTETVKTVTEKQTERITEPVKTKPIKTEPVTDPEKEIIPEETPAETKEEKKPTNFDIPNGKILSVIEGGLSGDVLVIKAKIESQSSNKQTINQNYENIEKIVRSDMFKEYYHDTIKSIDYWAVADMSNGSEGKVIAFIVSDNMIENILTNDYFYTSSYEDYVQDLWIHPSLNN